MCISGDAYFVIFHGSQVIFFYSFEIFSEDNENVYCTHRIYLSFTGFLSHPSPRLLKKMHMKHSKKKLVSEVEEYTVYYG